MDNLIPDGYGQAVPSTKPVVTQALKPCAHCGSDAELIDQRVGWFVKCKSCGCTVLGQFRHDIDQQDNDEQAWALSTSIDWEAVKQTAIAAWNTRAHSPPEPSELERGKDELRRLMELIWRAEYRHDAPNWQPLDDLPGMVGQIDNMYAGVRSQRDEARWALHNPPSPSKPSVVSQDLVEDIAFMLWKGEAVRAAPNVAKNRTPNSFRSDLNEVERERWLQQARAILPIIEAAQIAARNEALDEAALAVDDLDTFDRDVRISAAKAVVAIDIAAAIRSLRTPSQHQEEQ